MANKDEQAIGDLLRYLGTESNRELESQFAGRPARDTDRFVKLPSMCCPGCEGPVIRGVDDAACLAPDCVYYNGGIVKAWKEIAEIKANDVSDFNARRKRYLGIRDQGLCPCAMYFQLSCRTYCLRTGERHE